MFREMRRINQVMSIERSKEVLMKGSSGVFALSGDNDYPYALPINYVYVNDKIYFHCAKTGHKIDALNRCSKVSFCVIEQDQIIPEKFTSYFRSVIVFGQARIVENDAIKQFALEELVKKYSFDFQIEGQDEIKKSFDRTYIVEVSIDHLSGKEAIELVKKDRSI